MAHRQRWYVTQVVFEVTIRTLGGKFWLRPDAACKAIIEGVLGKALAERLRTNRAASRTEIQRLYPPGSLARPGWYIPTPANFQLPWQVGASDADRFAVAT